MAYNKQSILMYRRLLMVAFLAILLVGNIKAQLIYQPGKIIPPSPTAASLGRFGETPVSYYSGMPSISVPLYNVEINDFSLPITLTYSSNGVRVNENAGWVGLGWTMSAGGVITRTVRGADDFGNGGYFREAALPPNTASNDYAITANWPAEKQYLNDVFVGRTDSDPDLFSFNFAGFTGKFVLDKKANGSKVLMDEQNTLLAEFQETLGNWKVTDGVGNIYYFGRTESSVDYSYPSSSAPAPEGTPLTSFNAGIPVTTAWYLDSIVTPARNIIKFLYDVKGDIVSPLYWSEKKYNQTFLTGFCSSGPAGTYETYYSSKQVVHESSLRQIVFPGGTIDFITSDRTDLEYINSIKPGKLSDLIIKNQTGAQIKGFSFYYNYFTGSGYSRLKLDSIVEYGSSTAFKKSPYKFTYFDQTNLPPKVTRSVDYWGYYNNRPNQSLAPALTVRQAGQYFGGANREPDTTIANIRRGVLSSMTYPTGGSTEFEYELNDYSNLVGDDRYYITPVTFHTEADDDYTFSRSLDTFIIVNDTPKVNFRFSYSKTDPNAPDLINPELQYVYANVYRNGQFFTSYSNFFNGDNQDVVCFPGTYVIESRYVQGYSTRMWAAYDERIKTNRKLGAGLRIKAIRNKVDGKYYNVKKYEYRMNGDTSSGRLITKPVTYYSFQYTSNIDPWTGDAMSCTYTAGYVGRESSTVFSAGLNSSANPVGYDKVTEKLGENGEGGQNEYYYFNYENSNTALPFLPSMPGLWNGKLLKSMSYDSAGVLVEKTENEYISGANSETIKGLKLYAFDEITRVTAAMMEPQYRIKFYDNYSVWPVLSKETKTTYSGSQTLVAVKNFFYGNVNHKQMTGMQTLTSDGKIVTKKYRYPDDYTSAGSNSFVQKMKLQHIITPLIEEQTLVTGTSGKRLVQGAFIEYSKFGDAYKPKVIYQLRNDSPLADTTVSNISSTGQLLLHPAYRGENYFDSYDATGNLLDSHNAGGDSTGYLWDYSPMVPIAKVTNAAASAIAYSSFEAGGKGNWTYAGTVIDTAGITGMKCYNIASGAVTKTGLTAAKTYVVSYWTKNTSPYNIAGTIAGYPLKGQFVRGWTYFQHKIKGVTSITITGTGSIDELRLLPLGAAMYTYTYDPLVGVTTECNDNNQILYYSYDSLGRLKVIRDQERKIFKQFDYQFQASITK
ncbi:hypothetical protein [Chitinophaga sp. S165]|uniref:hypothetical protein n=1 Tax=Chitinophaga sp. S165 TaxID=2135462 RepID=UPI0011B3B48D|nr:hypothetical protein [Chitinophaga sp. S165]